MKSYFADLLATRMRIENEFIFDWLEDKEDENKKRDEDGNKNQFLKVDYKPNDEVHVNNIYKYFIFR